MKMMTENDATLDAEKFKRMWIRILRQEIESIAKGETDSATERHIKTIIVEEYKKCY